MQRIILIFLELLSLVAFSCSDPFTFLWPSLSYLEYRPTLRTNYKQGVQFQFTSRKPTALLFYQYYTDIPDRLPLYYMSLELENGHIKASHVFDDYYETLRVGKGLNHDVWHYVSLEKDPEGILTLTVDNSTKTIPLKAYTSGKALGMKSVASSVFIGGLREPQATKQYPNFGYKHFTGCIKDLLFLLPDGEYLKINYQSQTGVVNKECLSKCTQQRCQNHGTCINLYESFLCDCMNTGFEGDVCQNKGSTTITLHGYSYINYQLYDASERHHSEVNTISLQFKLPKDEPVLGTLFYGFGNTSVQNYLSIKLEDDKVKLIADLGDGPIVFSAGSNLNDNKWHTVSFTHRGRHLEFQLDSIKVTNQTSEKYRHFHLDTNAWIGGTPTVTIISKHPGLQTAYSLVGCLRQVYINHVNVLEQMKSGNQAVKQLNGKPEYNCNPVRYTPVTFPSSQSKLILDHWVDGDFNIRFDFRTKQDALILSLEVLVGDIPGVINLRLLEGSMQVKLVLFSKSNGSLSSSEKVDEFYAFVGKNLKDESWHSAELKIFNEDGRIQLIVDSEAVWIRSSIESNTVFTKGMKPSSPVYIGGGLGVLDGYIGCMKSIFIQSEELNVIQLKDDSAYDILLNGCDMRDLCAIEDPCEHGGECIQDWYGIHCDCSETGYTGKVCHFSLFRRSCEEYYRIGERRTGVWQIDLDGPGPIPPAYVFCNMSEDSTMGHGAVTIDHNLKSKTLVRDSEFKNLRKVLNYRDMTEDTLAFLVALYSRCSQKVTYECFYAPLRYGDLTWFVSTKKREVSLNDKFGTDCDRNSLSLKKDEIEITNNKKLPITEMIFKQENNRDTSDFIEGKVSLSPLHCREEKLYNVKHEISFRTGNSFLRLPEPVTLGKSGEISFDFRTVEKNAILLQFLSVDSPRKQLTIKLFEGRRIEFRTNLANQLNSFKVLNLVNDEYSLNDGMWHQVRLDYDEWQVRLSLDSNEKWLDMKRNSTSEDFIVFIGGLANSNYGGLLGCVRALVINGMLIPAHDYIKEFTDVHKGCPRSCHPNPCQNDGMCYELWGLFNCTCIHPTTYGERCEIDDLQNLATFLTPEAFMYVETKNVFQAKSLRFEFRTYQEDALIFYIYDHLNNFMQFRLVNNRRIEMRLNSGNVVNRMLVELKTAINNGKWVEIEMGRNPLTQQIALTANEESTFNTIPTNLLETYNRDPFPDGGELVIPLVRPISPLSPFQRMYVGGTDSNSLITEEPGLEGSVRAIFVDDILVNIAEEARNFKGVVNISSDFCDSTPCKNEGICQERWTHFECDCKSTSYSGKTCETEIGAFFDENLLLYHKKERNTITGNEIEEINLAFNAESSGVLLYLRSNESKTEQEYVLLRLKENGELEIEYDLSGLREPEKILGGILNFEERHYVALWRQEEVITVSVDGEKKEEKILNIPLDKSLFNSLDILVIGGAEKYVAGFEFLNVEHNFTGCISEIEVNGMRPLKQYFEEDKNAFHVFGGQIMESKCSSVTIIPPSSVLKGTATPFPTARKSYTYPPWNVGEAQTLYFDDEESQATATSTNNNKTIALAVVTFLLVILVSLLLWGACYYYKGKSRAKTVPPSSLLTVNSRKWDNSELVETLPIPATDEQQPLWDERKAPLADDFETMRRSKEFDLQRPKDSTVSYEEMIPLQMVGTHDQQPTNDMEWDNFLPENPLTSTPLPNSFHEEIEDDEDNGYIGPDEEQIIETAYEEDF